MIEKSIAFLQNEAFTNSAAHGFWADEPFVRGSDAHNTYLGNKLMLIVGEVSEAHEELRKGKLATETYYREDGKPEGIPSELADIVIRVFDFAEANGIKLQEKIEEKMAYNKSRPVKHGKRF